MRKHNRIRGRKCRTSKRCKGEPVKQTKPTLERIQAQEARGHNMRRERAKLVDAQSPEERDS